jgi:hypothetical protein
MQIIKLAIRFPLGNVELAARKHIGIGRRGEILLHFLVRERRKLRQKFEAPLANRLSHTSISHVGEKHEWLRRAKLLPLEKQRRPRSKQEQRSHGPIAP